MSNEIYSCDFKIRCLRDPNRVLKMPMQYALVNGEKCYFPCNGLVQVIQIHPASWISSDNFATASRKASLQLSCHHFLYSSDVWPHCSRIVSSGRFPNFSSCVCMCFKIDIAVCTSIISLSSLPSFGAVFIPTLGCLSVSSLASQNLRMKHF